jgi:hypothetical protein
VTIGASIVEPSRLGIDVIFPAAMAGLAVLLISGRRELVAAGAGAAIGVVVSLTVSTTAGVIAGGVLGPFVGLLVSPAKAQEVAPLGSEASARRYSMPDAMPDPLAGDEPGPLDGAEEPRR